MLARLLLLSATLGASQLSFGAPITFTFDGFASGSVGSTPFPDTPFTITVQSDTDQISNPFPTIPTIFATGPSPTTIEIEGFGLGSLLSGLSVYVNQGIRELGLTEPGANDLFALRDVLFRTYDLKSPLGPFLEPAPEDFVTFVGLPTTLGPVTLSDVNNITFTAVVGAQAIPEPQYAHLSLFVTGALLLYKRRFDK